MSSQFRLSQMITSGAVPNLTPRLQLVNFLIPCISFSVPVEADAFWFFDGDSRTEARQPRGFQDRSTHLGRIYDLCLLRGHKTIMQ